MALTRRQKEVLDFLAEFIGRRGYSPSFEEVGKSLGLSSLATVHKHVENLERKGFIRRGYNQSRSIDVLSVPGEKSFASRTSPDSGKPKRGRKVVPMNLSAGGYSLEFPLLGRIAAGHPVEAFPATETFSLKDFAGGSGSIFVLRVRGDSMIDDHICDGDYILVERARDAANGEIVVALIDNAEATLKRFFREANGNVRLQPANSQMDPLVLPASGVQVQGRVIGVLRKY
jgi:repressor LexA